jgi:signal transduction histidine kinase/CheY-like chemotaxis protein
MTGKPVAGAAPAWHEALWASTPDAVWTLATDGRVLDANPRAAAEHASIPATLRQLWQLDRPRSVDGAAVFLDEHPASRALRGQAVAGERLLVQRDGHPAGRAVEVHAVPLRDGDGSVTGAMLIQRDGVPAGPGAVAGQSAAPGTPSGATPGDRGDARDAQLAALAQAAAGMMHDLNNVLHPVMTAAFLLEARADEPDVVRDYAARIAAAVERGAATAARVGRFMRQQPLSAGAGEVTDLASVAASALDAVRPQLQDGRMGGTIVVDAEPLSQAPVRGLVAELLEAVVQLIRNAVDAMPAGGRLSIVTGVTTGHAWVEVGDTGGGISPEIRDRIFEPFVLSRSGGKGLGLAEVYGVVRQHGGEVLVDSTAGVGTRVRLILPRAATVTGGVDGDGQELPAPEAEPRRPDVAPGMSTAVHAGESRRILVVEDHPDSQVFMRALLAGAGHRVEVADSLSEARRLLAAGGGYDVVLVDVELPDGSGLELVRELQAVPPVPLLGILTGRESASVADSAADFVLRKPVRNAELLARVAAPRPRHSPTTPALPAVDPAT